MLCVDVAICFHGCVTHCRIISQFIHSTVANPGSCSRFLTIPNSAAVILYMNPGACKHISIG